MTPYHNITLPSPTLLSMEALTHASPLLKHFFQKLQYQFVLWRKGYNIFYLPGDYLQKMKVSCPRRRVQDPPATKTEANVFPKSSAMKQRSERTERLEGEGDVGEGTEAAIQRCSHENVF